MRCKSAVLVVLFPTIVFAATRHVAIGGSDSGDCSSAPGAFGRARVDIDKTLTLRGAQAGADARGRSGAETILQGPLALANVLVEQNDFANNWFAGVQITSVSGSVDIANNTFSDSVRLSDVDGVRIEGNAIALGISVVGVTGRLAIVGNLNRFAGNRRDLRAAANADVNAENNWFGCNEGPSRCGVVTSPDRIAPQRSSVVVADLNYNSDGAYVPGFPDGTFIEFAAAGGTVTPARSATNAGIATTVSTDIGEARVIAKLDGTEAPVKIVTSPPCRRAIGNGGQ